MNSSARMSHASSAQSTAFLLWFIALMLILSSSTVSAFPQQQKPVNGGGSRIVANDRFYFENAGVDFPPIIAKRRSAEFINGLLSLERLNAMGKRSVPPSLLWNVEK